MRSLQNTPFKNQVFIKSFLILATVFIASCASTGKHGTQKVTVHGHRGSRGTHPENTMPAFREGVSSTAEILELDLHLSKDNELIISHDALITDKLCLGKKGARIMKPLRIRELTLQQIKQFDCGSSPNPRFPEQKAVPGTSLATLDELLQWLVHAAPTVGINVETKMDEEDKTKNPDPAFFARRVIDTINKYEYQDRTILQSFDFRTLEAAKPLAPKLKRAALFETQKDFCHQAVEMNAQFASPDYTLMTEDEIDYCHKHGVQVAPWTVNDAASWTKVIDMGVDAIITDFPRKLVSYLSERAKNGHP